MSLNLEDGVNAVLEELKRQRQEGLESIYLEQATLDELRAALGSRVVEIPTPENPTSKPKELSKLIAKPHGEKIRDEASPFSTPPVVDLMEGSKESKISQLREQVLACPACNANLNPGAKVVFGVGDLNAEIFFCGEAPGADEEMAGEPFVGPAGKLLDKVIATMGLSREKVYIGNVMNWRPRHQQAFGNRPPTDEEMQFCMPYLKAQIEIVEPKVIVALGRIATNGLLQPDPNLKMGDLRGKWSEFGKVPVMVTYHPSYLLHNPSNLAKRRVWEDLLMVMERLEMSISEKQRAFFL